MNRLSYVQLLSICICIFLYFSFKLGYTNFSIVNTMDIGIDKLRGYMKTKKTKWRVLERLALFSICVLLIILGNIFKQNDSIQSTSLSDGWHLIQDGKDILVQLPSTIEPDENGQIILYNNSFTEADAEKVLSFSNVQYDLEIKINDTIVYQYEDTLFPKNNQMKGKLWADIELPEDISNSTIYVTYSNVSSSGLNLSTPVIGSLQITTGNHIQNSFFSIFMMLSMLNLGIIAIIIYLYMKAKNIYENRFFDVGLFLFTCSIWCMTDSGLYQTYGKHTAVGSLVSFYAFMLMSVPMLHFVQNTVSYERKYIPRIWMIALYANAFIQGIIYLLFHVDFIYMLTFTHILLFTGVIHSAYILWKEYKINNRSEHRLCFIAFSLLGLSGLIALVLYWLLGIYWYDAIFQFGILIFISLLFYGLIRTVSNDIQFRIEQTIYEKMSVIDRLTGLKNKKAFNQFMDDLQLLSNKYENALLIFIDLVGLKDVNDTYGLNVGDETIIATSRCIKKTVSQASNSIVECYRIAGKEFAVVILNPKEDITIYKEILEKEIQRYNHMCLDKHKMIHIQYGYSYLRNTDGTIKTISDWKAAADLSLSKNLERVKVENDNI